MSLLQVNPLAIIVVTILNIILGMIWYCPSLFGKIWAREHHIDFTEMKATPKHYIGAIIVSLVTAWIFCALIHWLNLTSIAEGLLLGFFLWLGFVATTHFSGVIWAQKPLKSYLIDAGFQLVSFLIMGAILTAWL